MVVTLDTIRLLVPELILVLAATYIFVVGTVVRNRTWWMAFAVGAYLIAGWALLRHEGSLWDQFLAGQMFLANGPLAIDLLGHVTRWLALLVGLLFTLMVTRFTTRALTSETLGLLMLLTVGIMLVGRANEMVFLFVALEMISIPTYVLLFLGRNDRINAESAAKYFFLSILASALLLYGFSFLYGLGGTTQLAGSVRHPGIREVVSLGGGQLDATMYPLALILIVAGLGFKVAAVPFHFYAPDVYQGTSNVNAGLLAVAPKIGGIVALVRVVAVAMPSESEFAWQLILVLSVLTMTIGNTCALWQNNIRRLMAFSSIAHAGYMFLGFAVGLAALRAGISVEGIGAMLFYLFVYVLASLGTFAALAALSSPGREVHDVAQLAGLGRQRPVVAAALAVFMFSLAGIPPLAGFWGKFTLLTTAIELAGSQTGSMTTWFIVLAVAAAVNAAVAAAYYLRVVGTMYFSQQPSPLPPTARPAIGASVAMAVCAWLIVTIGIMPGAAVSNARLAGQVAQHEQPQP